MVDTIDESDEGIHQVIGDINQRYLNPNNEESWKDLRDEAVEHLRIDVSRPEFESWRNVLSSDSKYLWSNWKGTFSSTDD